MKKLLLMRHAAANTQISAADIDRTISKLGIAEIEQAKKFVADIKINKVLVSPSIRTMQTRELIGADNDSSNFAIKEQLYLASAEIILEIIQNENVEIETLLVIGHNPAIYQLALQLADKKQPDYELLLDSNMPTCAIVELNFAHISKWQDMLLNSGKIIKIFVPEQLSN